MPNLQYGSWAPVRGGLRQWAPIQSPSRLYVQAFACSLLTSPILSVLEVKIPLAMIVPYSMCFYNHIARCQQIIRVFVDAEAAGEKNENAEEVSYSLRLIWHCHRTLVDKHYVNSYVKNYIVAAVSLWYFICLLTLENKTFMHMMPNQSSSDDFYCLSSYQLVACLVRAAIVLLLEMLFFWFQV